MTAGPGLLFGDEKRHCLRPRKKSHRPFCRLHLKLARLNRCTLNYQSACAYLPIAMSENCKRPRISEHYLCPHCGHTLNKKSFKEHKRLYFSTATKQWVETSCSFQTDSSDDDLPSLPESEPSDYDISTSLQEGGKANRPGSSLSHESVPDPAFSEAEEDCIDHTEGRCNSYVVA